jgi:predicted TIM-barrel enzyme
MSFEIMDGIVMPENRGRRRGSRNKQTAVRDAAIEEARALTASGMSKIAAATYVERKYGLRVQPEYIARLIGRSAKQRT